MKGFSRPPRIAPRACKAWGGGRAPTNGVPGSGRHRKASRIQSVSSRGARRCAARVSHSPRSTSHVGTRAAGVGVAILFGINLVENKIVIEFIDGPTAKDVLDKGGPAGVKVGSGIGE